MKKLTRAQEQTLAVMDAPDTAYSSASVSRKRWEKFGSAVTINQQFSLFRRMKEKGLVERVPDYSGDMWARALLSQEKANG
jgi:hypothetical protein